MYSPAQGKFIANTTHRCISGVYNIYEVTAINILYTNSNEFFLIIICITKKIVYNIDFFFCFLAQNTGEIVRNRKLLVVEKEPETQNSRQDGGNDGYGLVDMDYNSANKKRPIHNR